LTEVDSLLYCPGVGRRGRRHGERTGTMKTLTIASLYSNDNGRIVCPRHMGCAGESAYNAKPEKATYRTGMDTWERLDTDFVTMWVEEMGEFPRCEDCR
jgi:hypothetical protein